MAIEILSEEKKDILIKEKATSLGISEDLAKELLSDVNSQFKQKTEDQVNQILNRKLLPIRTPLAGRSVKFRDLFVISGLVSSSSTVTTVSTDSNGTTETSLALFSFFPNEFHTGMAVKITAFGTYTADATRTVTIRVGLGAAPVTEWNSIVSTAAAVTNAPWNLTWLGIVGSVGSSGALEAQLTGHINSVIKDDPNTATVTLDTTSSKIFNLTAQWSATTAGNSITIRQFLVEILN